ncbi:MAG TPA: FAD-binding oxidoreductase [Candidatus Limnocylindrales bacterium]|nr:FAD-binding oxidoreductase [Candidatus Limnocylindrales bacterium]
MSPGALGLTDRALHPGAERGYWLREALASDPGAPCPPLEGELDVDVVILGGGFTGLWTAFFLQELAPTSRIAILEQDICGGGPSGRNGGFATGWWDELTGLSTLYGREGALAAARAVGASVRALSDFCARFQVDAWYRGNGYMLVASSPMQEGAWRHDVRLAQDLGVGDEYRELSPAEVQARCQSPAFGGGAFMRDGASLQPARLARGLRRVVLQRGARIFEGTPALRWTGSPRVEVETPRGRVRAGHAVVALNAWAMGWAPVRRSAVAWSSYIALTVPAPDRLGAIGWTDGLCISDCRTSLHYFRTTPDGRIAMGGGGGRADGRMREAIFTRDRRAVAEAAAGLRRLFPSFQDVPVEDGWGGPIDVSPTHLPSCWTMAPGTLHAALGYTGNGVAPSHLAGQILARLALGREDEITRLPIVNPRRRQFPPEPLRSLGARIVRRAIVRKDDAEDAGRRADPLTRLIAGSPRRLGYLLGPE